MKWMLFAVVGLAAVVAIVAVIGAMLPRTHVASRSLTIARPPADVWAALMQATSASGVPVDVLESDPPRRQVTRVKETEKMFGGTWTITISPQAAGPQSSVVKIVEDGWVGNPIFRFMSRYVIGHHATLDGMLKAVAKTLNQEPALSGE
jgi:hypothetical protein